MKLFARGKGDAAGPAAQGPSFQPIDRNGLLGFLDQLVNGGQSGVLELREPRGSWTYAFQNGALTHASGGRVRGARQAFDLLWEFGNGEFQFTPGTSAALAGNLYIDKGRLLELLRRSQAVLQGPASPYIAPDQQRPIAPVQRPYSPPSPGQLPPQWQPSSGQPLQGQPAPGQPQAWPGAPQPGQAPAWGNGAYPPPPGYPQPYPQPLYGQNPGAPQPYQQQRYQQQPYPQAPQPPAGYPQQAPGQLSAPQQAPQPPAFQQRPPAPAPQPQPPIQAAPAPMPPLAPAPAPPRQVTPPSFSVPPMAIPKRKEPAQVYQPPVAPASAIPPVPEVLKPAAPTPPKDDLQALRASLVAQAPVAGERPAAPSWGVRTADGTASPTEVPARGGKVGKPAKAARGQKTATAGKTRAKSKLRAAIDLRLIKFLLWACERKYSADDHWTLKDAFEVSTMELRDQFIGAFSESFKSKPKSSMEDDDLDQMAAGRMRGRGRKR